MRIISDANELNRTLIKAIQDFNHISFAVAWASNSSKASEYLFKAAEKISNSTVGLHFHQTHPDFIYRFLDNYNIKYIHQKDGIYHPKIYLFWNDKNSWTALIGSANFTQSALTNNSEAMIQIDQDDNEPQVFDDIKNLLDSYHQQARLLTLEEYERYKEKADAKRKKRNHSEASEIFSSSEILQMDWSEYYRALAEDEETQPRLHLLETTRSFLDKKRFQDLTDVQRKNIAGVRKQDDYELVENWFLFGHMPVQQFANRVSSKDEWQDIDGKKSYIEISKLFETFRQYEEVDKDQYDYITSYFKKHSNYGYGISTISRLLAMFKPGQFFCLTKANEPALMEEFNIQKSIRSSKKSIIFERYWDEIILPVRKTKWYKTSEPALANEKEVWKGRVAMMDTLMYDHA